MGKKKAKKAVVKDPNELTVESINQLVWGDRWKGEVDNDALKERLHNLLHQESEYQKLLKELNTMGAILKRWVR